VRPRAGSGPARLYFAWISVGSKLICSSESIGLRRVALAHLIQPQPRVGEHVGVRGEGRTLNAQWEDQAPGMLYFGQRF
jgi:hypothetical protein